MKIDILSDLHFEEHFLDPFCTYSDDVTNKFDQIFKGKSGDILISAGDFGSFDEQIIQCFQTIKTTYYPQGKIILVFGNHEYHLNAYKSHQYKDSFQRIESLREKLKAIEGVYVLDGNIVEIDGIKIGGCDSWYDNAYAQKYFDIDTRRIANKWRNYMPEYRYMNKFENYLELSKNEKAKLFKIYKETDIMVTHVNPSLEKGGSYPHDINSTFFHFDGEDLLRDGRMKYWIFGHAHERNYSFEQNGVTLLCNTLGSNYYDVHNTSLMQIEV